MEEKQNSFATETANKSSFSSASSEKSQRVADNFEPVDIEGQKETGIWVHHPGSDVSQTWEPRKGKSRFIDTQILKEPNHVSGDPILTPGSQNNYSSSTDENPDDKHRLNSVQRGLHKISSLFHRSPKEDKSNSFKETVPSPHVNIKTVNVKEIGVKLVVEENLAGPTLDKVPKEVDSSDEECGLDGPAKRNMKVRAKGIFKHAEKSARSLKHVLSRKGTRSQADSPGTERGIAAEYDDSSDDESLPSTKGERTPTIPIASESTIPGRGDDSSSFQYREADPVVQTVEIDTAVDAKSSKNEVSPRGLEMLHDKAGSPVNKSDAGSPKLRSDEGDLEKHSE